MSSPSWYDLLGVAPDASPAEIKAAWRDATDKFEPGSGASQFRLFNEAADVLLDPVKRNRYDAELAEGATAGAQEPTVASLTVATPVEEEPEEATASAPDPAEDDPVLLGEVIDPEPEGAPATGRAARLRAGLRSFAGSAVALVLLGVLAAGSVAFAVLAFVQTDLGEKAEEYRSGRAAQAAAVAALSSVLSYDYRELDTPAKVQASLDAVTASMTPDLAERYRKAFTTVCRPDIDSPATAVDRQSVVTSTVEDPAVIDASADRVRLLVFVSQTTSNKNGGPNSRASQVVATLVEQNGRWLLDSVETKSQTPPQCVDPNATTTP